MNGMLLALGLVTFVAEAGGFTASVFISHDCPVSNHYAQEIRRICEAYAPRGVACRLIYVDAALTDAAARAHAREYQHGPYPVVVDRTHALVRGAGVTITPEVAVQNSRGATVYRGRIDDFFADLGKPRRQVREHTLRDAIDALLAGRAVPRPRTQAIGCFISNMPEAANTFPNGAIDSRGQRCS
jgi:hypothetical protein